MTCEQRDAKGREEAVDLECEDVTVSEEGSDSEEEAPMGGLAACTLPPISVSWFILSQDESSELHTALVRL